MTKEDLLKMTDGKHIANILSVHPELKDLETIAHSMKMLYEEKLRKGCDPNIHYDPNPRKD
jgi:hypothetical protein